jgi:Sec-independent protein translocase protein TatA
MARGRPLGPMLGAMKKIILLIVLVVLVVLAAKKLRDV